MYLLHRICSIKNVIKVLRNKRNVSCVVPKRFLSENVVDVNTNVTKDVILFKYINDRNFKIANVIAIGQFCFWTYLSMFAYSTLKDAPVEKTDEEAPWWRKINLGENKYRNTLGILSFGIGFGILAITWMYTLRSVKYLILRKGGQQVTVVVHTPFGENRMITLGLENLNCKQARTQATSQLPIKIKGHMMHYILDMKGEFKHPQLFDSTCGLARTLK